MKKLTKNQFDQALRKGHGRALLHVEEHGIGKYLPLLEQACLTNYVYDPQIEGSRFEWLHELIVAYGKKSHFLNLIKEHLPQSTNYNDVDQLAGIAECFADHGDRELVDTLYENFEKFYVEYKDSALIGSELVHIDGFEALGFTAKIIAKHDISEKDQDIWFYKYCCMDLGKKRVDAFLSKIPECKLWHKKIKADFKEYFDHGSSISKPAPNLDEVVNWLDNAENAKRPNLLKFAKIASKADLHFLYKRMQKCTGTQSLWRHLQIFGSVPPPNLDNFLFTLAKSKIEYRIRMSAFTALAQIKSRRIRQFAFDIIKQDPKSIFDSAFELFRKNYMKGDSKFIEEALRTSKNPEDLHSVGLDLIALFDITDDKSFFNCAMWVYENTPCSFCRFSAVGTLYDWKLLPKEIQAECRFDSFDETRDLCKKRFQSRS